MTSLSRHTCVDEELDKLAIGHQELWNEVDIPVTASAVLRLVRGRHPELGEELLQRGDGGGLPAVVFVSVHVKDLLAGDGEHPGQDALGEAGAEDDAVVFLIHGSEFIRQ